MTVAIRVTVAGSMGNRSKFIAGVTGRHALTSITRKASNTAVLVLAINVVHESGWDCSVGTVLFADIFCNSNRKPDFVEMD